MLCFNGQTFSSRAGRTSGLPKDRITKEPTRESVATAGRPWPFSGKGKSAEKNLSSPLTHNSANNLGGPNTVNLNSIQEKLADFMQNIINFN
jgi:hypothetical protein